MTQPNLNPRKRLGRPRGRGFCNPDRPTRLNDTSRTALPCPVRRGLVVPGAADVKFRTNRDTRGAVQAATTERVEHRLRPFETPAQRRTLAALAGAPIAPGRRTSVRRPAWYGRRNPR